MECIATLQHPNWNRDIVGQEEHPKCSNDHGAMSVGGVSVARNIAKNGLGTGFKGKGSY